MCRRTQVLSMGLLALGAGFLLSCLFESLLLRLLIGAALVVAGLFTAREGC